MSEISEEFLVSRQQAAKIIGVSTRTIDRYIAQEKFSIVRKGGKVLLDERELEEFKSNKNPVVAQVVKSSSKKTTTKSNESPLVSESSFEETKYQILYENAQQEVIKKEEVIRTMHYQLGTLETAAQNSIPALEAENEKREWEEFTDKLSEENIKLKALLKSAKNGRIIFFSLSIIFLLVIITIFIAHNGNLFASS
jgi:excisionase family DNA binding protein